MPTFPALTVETRGTRFDGEIVAEVRAGDLTLLTHRYTPGYRMTEDEAHARAAKYASESFGEVLLNLINGDKPVVANSEIPSSVSEAYR